MIEGPLAVGETVACAVEILELQVSNFVFVMFVKGVIGGVKFVE